MSKGSKQVSGRAASGAGAGWELGCCFQGDKKSCRFQPPAGPDAQRPADAVGTDLPKPAGLPRGTLLQVRLLRALGGSAAR